MTDKIDIHDSETEGLRKRGFKRATPIHDLVDTMIYEPSLVTNSADITEDKGGYFQCINGDFAKIWVINPFDVSTISAAQAASVSAAFAHTLSEWAPGSEGQYLKITTRHIGPKLEHYAQCMDVDNRPIEREMVDAVLRRQYGATITDNGFFDKLSPRIINEAKERLIGDVVEEARESTLAAVDSQMNTGKFPNQTEHLLVFRWSPNYKTKQFLRSRIKGMLAVTGAVDTEQLYKSRFNEELETFNSYVKSIEQSLVTNDFYPMNMTGQGLLDLLYRILNPVRSYEIPPPPYTRRVPVSMLLDNPKDLPLEQLRGQAGFSKVEPKKNGWDITYDDNTFFMRACSLKQQMARTLPGMLQQALKIQGENIVSLNFTCTPKLNMLARLWFKKKMITMKESMKNIITPDGEIGKETQLQLNDIEAVHFALTTENANDRQQAFDTSLHVIPMGLNEQAVEDEARRLEADLWRVGVREEEAGHAVIQSALPLNYRKTHNDFLGRAIPFMSPDLACLIPLFCEFQGASSPMMLLNNRDGQPIYADLWGDETGRVGHSLVCGGTNSGKSFLVNNAIIDARAKYKAKTWIIDKGSSYHSLCYAFDGQYIRLVTEETVDSRTGEVLKPLCFNPFYTELLEDGTRRIPSTDELVFLQSVIITMMAKGGGDSIAVKITSAQDNLITDALYTFFEIFYRDNPQDEATLSNFITHLKTINHSKAKGIEIVEALTKFFGNGQFAKLFDGKRDIDWDNDLIVLECERMSNSPALPVVLLVLFKQIDNYTKYVLDRDIKKLIIVDEAWSTLSDPQAAKALSAFFREVRRYGGAVMLVSQKLADFISIVMAEQGSGGKVEDGILDNTYHYWLLRCQESDRKLAAEHLNFSPQENDAWRSVSSLPPIYSEIFYRIQTTMGASYGGVVRLITPPERYWISTSDSDDFTMRAKLIRQYMEKGLNNQEAVAATVHHLAKHYPYGARYEIAA
ncbi:MAG: hypothetical protein V3T17_09850 [Pseudomonadales bacterium]